MNPLASLILPPLSASYSVAMRVRLTAYRRGWFSVSRLAAPVISVGNLTTGGTGKTPLVEWVCRVVAGETGKKVCVLTRGYGRANPQAQVVVSNMTQLLAGEPESGDEPYLLAKNLIGIAAVISNPDRLAAGKWAIKNLGSEVFVLDDGFQHLRLTRQLDIVTVDATNPWGGGSVLPYGRLREPLTGLSRADCVVITRTELIDNLSETKDAVQRLAGAMPVFTSRMVISGIRSLAGQGLDKKSLPAQPIAAFCGVGNPESFFNQLRHEGHLPVFTRTFADHHNYNQSDLDRLVKDAIAHGATALLTTAKDAIKLSTLELDLPCHVLDIQISIDDQDRMIEMIRNACGQRDF
jgi:tetraacyldisaccharide 4'-kinase